MTCCVQCGKDISPPKRKFCNSTCDWNHWYGKNKEKRASWRSSPKQLENLSKQLDRFRKTEKYQSYRQSETTKKRESENVYKNKYGNWAEAAKELHQFEQALYKLKENKYV